MKHYSCIRDFYKAAGYPTPLHPQFGLAILEGSGSSSGKNIDYSSDFYMMGFKRVESGEMAYGRTKYDYENGGMFFFKPRQKISIRNVQIQNKGFVIHIHEDFLAGCPLFTEIQKYGYFDYEANEALHMSSQEEKIMWDIFSNLQMEYQGSIDLDSKHIMLSLIDSMLKYAQRFYRRQFTDRKQLSGYTITKFESYLNDYFEKRTSISFGLPTVSYLATQLAISPKYLSDMLKMETGMTALDIIHVHMIRRSKNLLLSGDFTISEVAHELGFENLSYFSRLFKKQVGISPNIFVGNSKSNI